MQVYLFPNIPSTEGLAVTTGFFDGVHYGHVAVLNELKSVAAANNLPSCIVTYDPHPRIVLGKDEGLQLLTCLDEKQQRLATLGIDYLVVIPFSKELAAMESHIFIEKYIVKSLNTKKLIVGFNHNIGKDAAAGFEKIKSLGSTYGIETICVQARTQDGHEVSSTKIRKALAEGNITKANAMLGYAYQLQGQVISGSRVGRTIGYPTANIQPECKLKMLPKDGVYAVHVTLANKHYGGMLNIGTRPTVDNSNNRSIEVHIFDFFGNIYDSKISISIIERLRDEKEMNSLDELKEQLAKDEVKARKILTAKAI